MGWHLLDVVNTPQETGYWCAPGSAQIALSAQGIHVPEGDLAYLMFTTEDGTADTKNVVDVLNLKGGGGWVKRAMQNDPPTRAQTDLLWLDTVTSINNGRCLVYNIWATATNHPPGYPNDLVMHYICGRGYNDDTGQIRIADPARFGGLAEYDLSLDKLASLIPPKGYAANLMDNEGPAWDAINLQMMGVR